MQLSSAFRITRGDVVAFVGGGGKTMAMFNLANELSEIHKLAEANRLVGTNFPKPRILTTTTTRIFAAQISRAPAHVTFNPKQQTIDDILPQLDAAIDKHNQVLLIGQADSDSGKAFGVPPVTIDKLAASGRFDIILNEADGSRMRPFKAPANHEPVIPSYTTLVVPVVGLDVLSQPLSDESTHRAERVSQLTDTPLGRPVTAETISRLLCHPQGGLKGVPNLARVVPLLNKVENSTRLASAQEIAIALLTCQHVDAVAIGTVQNTQKPVSEVHGRTAAVILAAGGSSRFGSPKQLARWGNQTFIERVVDVALDSKAEPVVVVLGAKVEQCRTLLEGRPVQIVENKQWREGQSTSMQSGLAVLPKNISSAVFLLTDLPGITPQIVNALIERHRQTMAPIVWPEFEGKRGNPVLFDKSLFDELMQISGDTGGRPVLMAHKDRAELVEVNDAGILQDFDRPEDLQKIKDKEI